MSEQQSAVQGVLKCPDPVASWRTRISTVVGDEDTLHGNLMEFSCHPPTRSSRWRRSTSLVGMSVGAAVLHVPAISNATAAEARPDTAQTRVNLTTRRHTESNNAALPFQTHTQH